MSRSAENAAHPPVVLVIEDEFFLRLNIVSCLQEAGYAVVEAATGEEAIALCHSDRSIDVVFTDVNLGGYASGWDPSEMIKGAGIAAGARGGVGKFAPQIAQGAQKLIGKVDAKTARRVAELLTSDDPRLLQEGYKMAAQSSAIMNGLKSIANRVALAGQTPARGPVTEGVKSLAPYRGPNLGELQGPGAASADDKQQQP